MRRHPRELADQFAAHQGELDAMVNYESVLLSLNASGKLTEQLEIVYPRDGSIESDYPLLLLDPAKREAYDRAMAWLKTPATQEKIMGPDRALHLAGDVPDGRSEPS